MALDDGGDADGMMPMVANAAFSRNVDLEDEDELLHRLDQYIARRYEFLPRKRRNSYE